jgi:hypothetical protein
MISNPLYMPARGPVQSHTRNEPGVGLGKKERKDVLLCG